MILENSNKVQDIFSTSELGIVSDGMVFNMLMDGIYTDKLGSVLREISTNCRDSLVAIGSTENFSIGIKLLEKHKYEIRIKDYGLGLSKEEVEEYLCKLNASSKRDSNDFVGCFGIGSKSVLAICNQYTYICSKDNTTTELTIVRQGKEAPNYDVSSTPNEARNSVECIFTIEGFTTKKILESIYSELLFFDIKPIITYDNGVAVETYLPSEFFGKVVDRGNFYVVYPTPTTVSTEGGVVERDNRTIKKIACGIIGYNCSQGLVKTSNNNFSNFYRTQQFSEIDILGSQLPFIIIVPKLPLGSIDFSVSREEIANTPKSIKALEDLAKELLSTNSPFRLFLKIKALDYNESSSLITLNKVLEIKDYIDNHYMNMSKEDFIILVSLFEVSFWNDFCIALLSQITDIKVVSYSRDFKYFKAYLSKTLSLDNFESLNLRNSLPDSINFNLIDKVFLNKHINLNTPLIYREHKRFSTSKKFLEENSVKCLPIKFEERAPAGFLSLFKALGLFNIYELEEYKEINLEDYNLLTHKRARAPKSLTSEATPPPLTSDGFKAGIRHASISFYNTSLNRLHLFENELTSLQLLTKIRSLPRGFILCLDEDPKITTVTEMPYFPTYIFSLDIQSDPQEVFTVLEKACVNRDSGLTLLSKLSKESIYTELKTNWVRSFLPSIISEAFSSILVLNKDKDEALNDIAYNVLILAWSRVEGCYVHGLNNSFKGVYTKIPLLAEIHNEILSFVITTLEDNTKILESDTKQSLKDKSNEYFQSKIN